MVDEVIDLDDHTDPYGLMNKKKSKEELENMKKKHLKTFYKEQNETILELLKDPMSEPPIEHEEMPEKIALYGSFLVNILLFGLQLYAAISSKSLSILAALADSFMDILSGIIMIAANKASKKKNRFKYPVGKARYETIGVLVFSCLMSTVSINLIIESIKAFLANQTSLSLDFLNILLVCLALGLKVILCCYCFTYRKYPSVHILFQDHRNDLIVNGFGLTMGILAQKYVWYLDPLGALLVALIILRSWVSTAYEQIQLIVGKTAPVSFLQKVTYLSLTHNPKIIQVDTCRAYHAGEKLICEVDIVLPPEMTIRESHDIAESLQMKLEKLSNVERAFVHIDYEATHKPEH